MGKKVLRAYQYRFYPTLEEMIFLHKIFGCCRFVYNYFLAEKQRVFKEEKDLFPITNARRISRS